MKMQHYQKLSSFLVRNTIQTLEMQMGIIRGYYHRSGKKLQVFAFQCNEQCNAHYRNG
jgi:hypothetical protein